MAAVTGAPPASLEVSGGAGGTTADLQAMHAAADELRRCAGEVDDLALRLAALAADVARLGTVALDPAGWGEAQHRLVTAAAGPGGLGALAAETTALAVAVDAAASAYAAADRAAAAAVSGTRDRAAGAAGQLLWRVTWRFPLVVLPPALLGTQALLLARTGDLAVATVADAARDAGAGTFRVDSLDTRLRLLGVQVAVRLWADGEEAAQSSLRWLAARPGVSEHVVAATPSFLSGATGLHAATASRWGPPSLREGRWRFPPEDVDDAAAVTAALGHRTGLFGGGPVSVRTAGPSPRAPTRPPAGVADLLARTAALQPVPAGPGRPEATRIRVEHVRSGTTRASIVYVPGTQTWGLGHGTNPMDVTSNIEMMAGLRSASQEAVVGALRAAGVGRDEPLLLVGYSQGGLISMGLVGDPAFTTEFSPAAVVTAGAPVAGASPPDDVAVLSLEHAEDLVTVLDGAPNPNEAGWTTVRRDVLDPVAGDRQVQSSFEERPLAPHDAQAYVRTAAIVDAADDDSLDAWREHVAPFLDRPGATAVATGWVAARTPS